LQPRPQCSVSPRQQALNLPDGVCNPVRNGSVSPRHQMFRTGLQTPSGNGNLANPVRQWPSAMVLSVPGSKCFGRGCKPRPAMAILQTPSGNGRPQWFCQSPTPNVSDGVANPVRQWPSAMVLSVPGSKCFGRGCKPRPAIEVRQHYNAFREALNVNPVQCSVHGHVHGLPKSVIIRIIVFKQTQVCYQALIY